MGLLLLLLFLLAFRWWPQPSLAQNLPLSTAYYDSQDNLLRLTLASDDRYRQWHSLSEISPLLTKGILLHEDRWFYYHPGFNPVSLLRGFWHSYIRGGRQQGGSTLSMQLARMRWQLNTRTPQGKLWQVIRAIQLELSYSKSDILEAYLNYAPYGRNIESIGAASLIYFAKQPSQLTLPEALTLAVLPQSPSYRLDKKTGIAGEKLTQARNRLFRRWQSLYPTDENQLALFSLPLILRQPEQLPFLAAHFVEQIQHQYRMSGHQTTRVTTTLDSRLQQLVEQQVNAFISRHSNRGIHNASVLLLDYRDMGIRALVGSANYHDRSIHGQVNGTKAKRSPGSTLKPFIYALGLEQGLLHPMTILKDVPVAFGSYAPENFDHRFLGPVTATDALNYSRNIPAVYIASRLKKPDLYQFLQLAGVSNLASRTHYGLSLSLGGGEITVQELARLYAVLANRGLLHPLRFEQNSPPADPLRLLSQEASFVALDMLRQHRRPGDTLAQPPARLSIYWKTGTSWGFRDAWSAGVVGPYVLVVWQGNFDGRGNGACVGADAAAPLFFNIIDHLAAEDPDLQEPTTSRPERLKKIEICLASGNLPTVWCQQRGQTWFIPGKSPIRIDEVYHPVVMDITTGKTACPPYDPQKTRTEIFEFWPADLLAVFAQAGLPKQIPPDNRHCRQNAAHLDDAPQILSPKNRTLYHLRPSANGQETILLNATASISSKKLFWFVDQAYLGTTKNRETLEWRPINNGRYQIRVIDEQGLVDQRAISVEIHPR